MVWGIILVVVGVLWLFSNFGWFSWDFWNVAWLLWPLALVLVGLSFLLRGSKQRLPILLGVALIGGAALWFWNSRPGATGSVETISQELRGATQAEVSISPGVGRLDLGSLEDNPTSLLEGRIELLPGERLEKSSNMRGGTAVVKIATKGSTSGFRRQSEGWNLRLSPKIPISLRVNLGVGESQLNLRELKLSGLDVGSGVGRVEVDLPRGSYSAKVSGGVGEVVINLPGEAAVRLSANAGLGGVDVPDGLVKTGDKTYESRNYSEATDRIILEVSGGVGKVEVNQ